MTQGAPVRSRNRYRARFLHITNLSNEKSEQKTTFRPPRGLCPVSLVLGAGIVVRRNGSLEAFTTAVWR